MRQRAVFVIPVVALLVLAVLLWSLGAVVFALRQLRAQHSLGRLAAEATPLGSPER